MAVTASVVGVVGTVATTASALSKSGSSSPGAADGQAAADYRQQASDLWNNLALPAQNTTPLEDQTWLQDYAPENYQAYTGQLTQSTDDPASIAAQQQALAQMQALAKGGLQPADIAALQQIQQQQAGTASSQSQAAQDAMRSRGLGGAGAAYAATLAANQGAANSANSLYNNAATTAMNRQLTAIGQAGSMASANRAQDNSISQQMASNANAFNTQVQQIRNAAAISAMNNSNQAQAANLAGRQQVANANVATTNQNVALSNQLAQNAFANQTTKIAGQSNALNAQSTLASANQAAANQQALGNSQQITAGLQGITSAAKGIDTAVANGTTPGWYNNLFGSGGSSGSNSSYTDSNTGNSYQSSSNPDENF